MAFPLSEYIIVDEIIANLQYCREQEAQPRSILENECLSRSLTTWEVHTGKRAHTCQSAYMRQSSLSNCTESTQNKTSLIAIAQPDTDMWEQDASYHFAEYRYNPPQKPDRPSLSSLRRRDTSLIISLEEQP